MNHKSLDPHKISTDGIDLSQAATLYREFFINCDYNWWYEVLPDDIVVDVGACVGFFSALALDKGAERVFMIEPNRNLLKTAINNVADYIIDDRLKVIPVHGAVSEDSNDTLHVFEDDGSDFPKFSFMDFIHKHQISNIDFLKVDCEGAEYNIFKKEQIGFFENNVRHMAIECHLRAADDSPEKFIKFREDFLKHFINAGKVKVQNKTVLDAINNDWSIKNRDFRSVPAEFMIYITNW
jgi:FkbM family methyltransferase